MGRWGRAAIAALIVALALVPLPATATELPPAGNGFWLQTNGPNAAVTLGDWYTSNAAGAGAGYHYVQFQVPCGWPAGLPIYVDLFSPEMNRVAGAAATHEEPNGNYDSTQFELYGPGATVGPGYANPAPGAGIPGTRITYEPAAAGVAESWVRFATLAAPVTCGSYVLRSQVLTADPLNPGGTGDDQNGWRLRVGYDNDGNANNAPPASYDNPDGVAGTNDEIVIGMAQTSYQQNTGGVACQTFYEYVPPGAASVKFNNFDMDGVTRLRYYAPGDPSYDPNANSGGIVGTMSGNGVWNNGGTLATRVGDTIAAPASGWWRIVNCLSNGNQLIQEGQTGVLSYYTQPPTPNLTLTKSDGVANASPGQTLTYTINASNTSAGATAGAATNVVVTDTIPAGTTYSGCAITTPAQGTWTCSQAAGVVTFTQTGWINAGANAQLTVTVTVNQGVSGSITDTARVNYKDALGNTFPQLTATDTDPIVPQADLRITKTDSADPVNPGQAFTYTLTATNNGPSNATNITVSDTVPAQFTVTGVSSAAGTCGNAGNVVTCTRPTFNNGATWTITVNVTANANAPGGTYTDTATITGTEADPTPANNSGSQTTTIASWGDLSITKSDGVASVTAGTSTTYTITVTNNGPTAEPAGVVVSDPIPAGTVGSESEADCSIAGGTFTCTTASPIASGASRSYQLTLAVSSGYAPATLTNTATITVFPITDPNAANNSASDTDNVIRSADLSIAKTDSADPVNPGQAFTYTLTVTNNGPSDASTLTVSDTVPAQFTVTGVSSGAGSCGNVGNVVTCTRPTLAASATWTITVNVTVNAATPGGTYTNTATVSATTADPVPGNNSGSQSTTVGSTADLSITKSDGVASVTAGTSTTYTITVTNNGPTAEPAGVVVSDPIPAGTVGSESEADCSIAGGTFTCTTASPIASGASRSYQLTLNVSPGYAPATLTNTATITVFPISDPNAANNAATDTDTVTRSADLSITKSDGVASVTAGASTTYTITVTNNGPSTVPAGVVVSDPIPAGTAGSEFEADCSIAGGTFTCMTTVPIAPGGTVSYQLTLNVSAGYGPATLSNTATITSSPATDPNSANDSATDTDTVTRSADLSIAKTDGVGSVTAGASTTYTITATNNGPSAEPAGVVITDPIPAGTAGSESEADCAIAGGTFTCTTSSPIAPGASVSYQLTLTLGSGYASATLVNTATISGTPIADPNGANDAATDTDSVAKLADLSVTKTDSADPVTNGQAFSYTITVTDNGPSDASAVLVTDSVPAQFTVTGVSSGAGACGNVGNAVTCTRATLAAAGTWTITVNVTVNLATVAGTYTNTATVSSATSDPVPGNDSGSQSTTVVGLADLSVAKTDGVVSVAAGTSTTYTITVTNNGPSIEPAGVVVSDPIPAGTIGSESEADCAIAGGTFTCTTSAPIVAGGSVAYQLTLAVSPAYALPTLVNTASVTSAPLADPNAANDTATDTDAVTRSADLAIAKSDGVASVVAGTSTTYTITVSNTGPSTEPAGVVVSDPIPAGTNGSESEADCAIAGGTFTCTTSAPIVPGGSVSYQLTLAVAPTYALPTLANSASITSTPIPDPNGANDSATDTDTVTVEADLAITKTDGSATVVPGTSATYTITVTNTGPSTEPPGVVVSDPIPAGTNGSESEADCAIAAGVFTCTTTAALGPGASVSWQLTLALPASSALATLANTATITTFPITDPNAANDAATDTDTVTPLADLSMVKTDSTDPIDPGLPLDYTLTVTNNGPSDAHALTVTDDVPAAFTITAVTSASGSCGFAGSVATCTLATLPAGGIWVITVSVFLDPATPGGLYTDTATVTSTTSDPVPGNNADSESTVVLPAANETITKSDGVASVTAGGSTTYTITLTNQGPSAEPAGMVLSDPIPAGTTGSESEADCAIAGGVFTCTTSSALAPSASVSYQLTVDIPASYAGATLDNTASITSTPIADIDPTDNSATDSDTIVRTGDLSIAKDDGVASVTAGWSTTYTITVSNAGPSDVPAGVVISDPIPAGTNGSESEADCSIAGGVFTCTTSAAIPVGGGVSYQLTLAVGSGYASPTLVNTATIASSPANDPNPANDSATDTDAVTTSADLSIVKTDNPDPVAAGSNLTYTLTVTNDGPSDAQGVSVVDTLPPTVAFVSATPSQGTCSQALGVVTCPLGTIPASGTASISIVVTPTIDGTITNTATVSSSTPDPVPGNDSDSQDTTVTPVADLSITKTDGAATFTPGTPTTYTITVANGGPSTEPSGVMVSDPIPAGTNGSESEADCAIAGGTFTCTTGAPIPSGGSVSYQLTVSIPSSYALPTLDNTATIATFPVPDPNPANDAATDSDAISTSADLSITKTDSTDPVDPGQAFTYTIIVTNGGPSDATSVTVTDSVPPQFTVTGVSSPTGTCGNVGNAVTCTRPVIPASGAMTIFVDVTVDPATPAGTYTNTATVSSSTPDPVPGDDAASQDTTVSAQADLSIAKSDGSASVSAGGSTTYTITITNDGPSTEPAGVVITDPIPPGTNGSESEADCAIAGGTFTCTTSAPIPSGASVSYQLTLAVPAGYALPTLANTATITSTPIPDPNPANDSSTDTDAVSTSADLSITKTDGVAVVAAGTSTTYAITVTNNGPSDEPAGVVVSDPIPAGTTGSESEADCAIAGGAFTCTTSAAVPAGGSVSYQLTLNVSAGYAIATLVNTATITSTPIPDPNAANDSASDTDTLSSAADLSIVKTDSPDPVLVGATLTYTLTVTNAGPADATGVTVTDTLPGSVTFVNAVPSQGTCSQAAGTVSCALGPLAASASATIAITVTPTAPGTISNTASVSSSTPDPNPANDSDTETTTVSALAADLSITKTDSADPVMPGQTFGYTLTVSNAGPGDAANLTVTDTVPAQFTVTGVSSPVGSCANAGNAVTCTLPTLAAGSTWTITIQVTVGASTVAGTYTNTATVASATADPNPANDTGSQSTTVASAAADISLTKTDSMDPVDPGGSFSYTLTVTNIGPADASTLSVTDTVPPPFTVTSVSASAGTCANVGNAVACTLPTLALNATWTITIQVDVPADAPGGTYSNTASVTAATADPTPLDETDTETTTVNAVADLTVTKTVNDTKPSEGDTITYTVTVSNAGPSDATGVVVSDRLPNGLTFVGANASQGSYDASTGLWNVGDVAVGGQATLTIRAKVDQGTGGTTLANTASVGSVDQTDPDQTNDSGTAMIDVAPAGGTNNPGGPGTGPASGGTSFTGANVAGGIAAMLLLLGIGASALFASGWRRRQNRA